MSPKQRFAWWVVVVVAWVAAAPLRSGGFDVGWTIATSAQTVALVLMLGLLVTTPPEAIKLRGPVSWTVLLLGVWLNLVFAVPERNNSVLIAALVLSVAVPVGVWSTVLRPGGSAWWVAIVAWSPALPTLVARRVQGQPGPQIGLAWGLCLVGLVVAMALVWVFSRRSAPKADAPSVAHGSAKAGWVGPAWILGIATALCGVVPWLS